MTIKPTINLVGPELTAFQKRVTGTATTESLAETLVIDAAKGWADADAEAELAQIRDAYKRGDEAKRNQFKQLAK